MSRIDEALRRAAEEKAAAEGGSGVAAGPAPIVGAEAVSLANEPFPFELAERRKVRSGGAAGDSRSSNQGPSQQRVRTGSPWKVLLERIDRRLAEKVVADTQMGVVSREQYRRLAAMLHDAQTNTGMRAVMIASAVPGEGKTLTAVNVALTLSESYRRRVLLIDADLRKPALHEIFQLNSTSGLIDGLEAQSDVKLVLRQVSANLWVLPAGRPTPDPMAALTSEAMKRLIDEARESFDWVIVDTPPLMLLPDAHLLSALVDRAVLVVRANSTPHDFVRRTAEIVGKARVMGVVLNQAAAPAHIGYGEYYGGYYLKPAAEPAQK